jgi:TRAP-type C4-dicarboxylate transport system permease small subunit
LPGGQKVSLLVADLIWIAFNSAVVIAGIQLILQMAKHPVYSTSLFLPMIYVYTVIPLAHAMMILRILQRQWRAWRDGTSVVGIANEAGDGTA